MSPSRLRTWWLRSLASAVRPSARKKPASFRPWLELMEPRWLPAGYTVTSQLQVIRTSDVGGAAPGHQVVFFESSVADYQALYQSIAAGTDAVVLDAGGDGLREMAAFLAGRHGLTAVSIVAHGAPAELSLGSATLNTTLLSSDASALAAVKASLAPGGDLLLWSCDVAASLP